MSVSFNNATVNNVQSMDVTNSTTSGTVYAKNGVLTGTNYPTSITYSKPVLGSPLVFTIVVGESLITWRPAVYTLDWSMCNDNSAGAGGGTRQARILLRSTVAPPGILSSVISETQIGTTITITDAIGAYSSPNQTFTVTLSGLTQRTVATITVTSYTGIVSIS